MEKLLFLAVVCAITGQFLGVTADDNKLKVNPVGYSVESRSAKTDRNERDFFRYMFHVRQVPQISARFETELRVTTSTNVNWTFVYGFGIDYHGVLQDIATSWIPTMPPQMLPDANVFAIGVLMNRYNAMMGRDARVDAILQNLRLDWATISNRNTDRTVLMTEIGRLRAALLTINNTSGATRTHLNVLFDWANMVATIARYTPAHVA